MNDLSFVGLHLVASTEAVLGYNASSSCPAAYAAVMKG
jgi:hypothetical protein